MRQAGTDKEFINMRLDDAARVDYIVKQSVVHALIEKNKRLSFWILSAL